MVITIYGAGYVGLVSAVCFAKIGHHVVCVDINAERVSHLNSGECPIYEAQLPELLKEQLHSGRLEFTTDLSQAIEKSTVHFIATGTPSLPDGSADLSQVYAVARQIAREASKDSLLVIKSTVPVGTGDAIQAYVEEELGQSNKNLEIRVASNPEFLREGTAVHDFLYADRIIIGGEPDALSILKEIYHPLVQQNIPLLSMSRLSSELTKYAANTMLACRISFMNQLSRIAEKAGADIDEIKQGMGADPRIGPYFLQAGIGYGGSCFPKDNRALIQTAKEFDINVPMLEAIETINKEQKYWVVERLNEHFKSPLKNKVIGIWGLAFKPGTDDIREASSLVIIDTLLKAGASLRLYDPVAMPNLKALFRFCDTVIRPESRLPEPGPTFCGLSTESIGPDSKVIWCASPEEVLQTSLDALVIATEWPIFQNYSLMALKKSLGEAPIVDGRNCFSLQEVKKAAISYYYSVGRPFIGKDS
jgi:UDPglucose 6-dehydrogenase